NHRVDLVAPRDIDMHCERVAPITLEQRDGLRRTDVVDVGDDDPRAMGSEQLGCRSSLPGSRAGDDRDAPLEQRIPTDVGRGDAHPEPSTTTLRAPLPSSIS